MNPSHLNPPSPAADEVSKALRAHTEQTARQMAAEYYVNPTEQDILILTAVYTRGLLDGLGARLERKDS